MILAPCACCTDFLIRSQYLLKYYLIFHRVLRFSCSTGHLSTWCIPVSWRLVIFGLLFTLFTDMDSNINQRCTSTSFVSPTFNCCNWERTSSSGVYCHSSHPSLVTPGGKHRSFKISCDSYLLVWYQEISFNIFAAHSIPSPSILQDTTHRHWLCL